MDPKLQKVLCSKDLHVQDIVRLREIPLKELSELTPENRQILQEQYVEVIGKFQTLLQKDIRKTMKMAKKFAKNKDYFSRDQPSRSRSNPTDTRTTDHTVSELNQAIQGQKTLPSTIVDMDNVDQARQLASLLESIPGPSSRDAASTVNQLMEDMTQLPYMEEPNLFVTLPGDPQPGASLSIDLIPEVTNPPAASTLNIIPPEEEQLASRSAEDELEAELNLFGLLPLRGSSTAASAAEARGRKRKARARPLKMISYANYYPRPARPNQLDLIDEFPDESGIYSFLRNRVLTMTLADLPTMAGDPLQMDVEQEQIAPTLPAEIIPAQIDLESDPMGKPPKEVEVMIVQENEPLIPEITNEISLNPTDTSKIPAEASSLSQLILMEHEQPIVEKTGNNNPIEMELNTNRNDQEKLSEIPDSQEMLEVPSANKIAPFDFSTPSRPGIFEANNTSAMSYISLPIARAEQSIESIPSLRSPNISTVQPQNSLHVSNIAFDQQSFSAEKMNFLRRTYNKVIENNSVLLSEMLTEGESRINLAWKLRLLTEFDSQLWRLEINNEHALIGVSKLEN